MSDSLVRVSRRVGPLRRRHDPGGAFSGEKGRLVNPRPGARWATAVPGGVGVPACGAQTDRAHPGGARPPGRRQSGSLASNDFTYYFTFFSKFFSSFPHGTCSLSVSGEYLALEGIYLPLCATVPSNTTLSTVTVTGVSQDHNGAITLYSRLSQQPFRPQRYLKITGSRPHVPSPKDWDFKIELFPLQSPLLRESLLVSFPPLNNMFKFGGSSCLSPALKHVF